MIIENIEIRSCRSKHNHIKDSEMRDSNITNLDFLVITASTDDDITASTFGFAGRSADAAGQIAADSLKPFFLGKDPEYREKHWHDYRMWDRWWHHSPIYSYGPFDILCWLLPAIKNNLPLYKYMGAFRDSVPIYSSSLVFPDAGSYAEEALRVKERGWSAYKLHPNGGSRDDIEAYRQCREAVGDDFILMSDPVAYYTYAEALKVGRELEKLNYYWLEEPVFDSDFYSLKKLTEKLDIPICGVEVLANSPYSTAQCITGNVVDIVRTDVSWRGGITSVLKTAHLAEAFGIQCEVHTAIFEPLELVNLHCCAAIKNSEFFEVLEPREYFEFGLKENIQIENGQAILPKKAGLGIELDWDFIDDCTRKIL
jgi:L-alanine-DL-glutamate epimerase-like enolase superfamily enzyme